MSSTPEQLRPGIAGAREQLHRVSQGAHVRGARRGPIVAIAIVALSILLSSCSADSDSADAPVDTTVRTSDGTSGDDVNTTYGGDTAGTVMVSSSAITGQGGRMLLVFASSKDQGGQAGVACVQISGDSFEMPATMLAKVPSGDNPCAGGTDVAVLPDGEYVLSAGVYEPGSQQPEAQMSLDFAMDGGAVTFELQGANLSSS